MTLRAWLSIAFFMAMGLVSQVAKADGKWLDRLTRPEPTTRRFELVAKVAESLSKAKTFDELFKSLALPPGSDVYRLAQEKIKASKALSCSYHARGATLVIACDGRAATVNVTSISPFEFRIGGIDKTYSEGKFDWNRFYKELGERFTGQFALNFFDRVFQPPAGADEGIEKSLLPGSVLAVITAAHVARSQPDFAWNRAKFSGWVDRLMEQLIAKKDLIRNHKCEPGGKDGTSGVGTTSIEINGKTVDIATALYRVSFVDLTTLKKAGAPPGEAYLQILSSGGQTIHPPISQSCTRDSEEKCQNLNEKESIQFFDRMIGRHNRDAAAESAEADATKKILELAYNMNTCCNEPACDRRLESELALINAEKKGEAKAAQ